MPAVILFLAGAIILVVWLAVRNSAGTGRPPDHPHTDAGGNPTWIGADGHTSHHHSDDSSFGASDGAGDSGSGDAGGGDGGGGSDGGGGGSD